MVDDDKKLTKKTTAKPEAPTTAAPRKTIAKKAPARPSPADKPSTVTKKTVAARKTVARPATPRKPPTLTAPPKAAISAPTTRPTPAASAPKASAAVAPAPAPLAPAASPPTAAVKVPSAAHTPAPASTPLTQGPAVELPQLAAIDPAKREAMIREAAYYLSEKQGFDPSYNDLNWEEATKEIDALLARQDLG